MRHCAVLHKTLPCILMSSLLNSVGVGVSVGVDDIGFEVWQKEHWGLGLWSRPWRRSVGVCG